MKGGVKLKIAIIGMGAAGISVLRELVTQLEHIESHTIIIYSDLQSLGTGLPYQKDDNDIILNQYTETMSLAPNDELDFVKWVKKNKDEENPIGKYMPRSWYGEYLLEFLGDLLIQSKAIVKKGVVTAIQVSEDKKYIITTETEDNIVDCIHLTTGHLAYQDPYHLKEFKKYIHHPYPVIEKVVGIPSNSHVAILGTGLTALDLMIYLRKVNPKMIISMISPDGKFSSIRGPEKDVDLIYLTKERILAEKEKLGGIIPFETIKDWFIKEVEHKGLDIKELWRKYGRGTIDGLRFDLGHLEELGKFQAIISGMKRLYAEIWNALSEEGREQFLANYADRFLSFRSPIPVASAQKIIEGVDEGFVKIEQNIKEVKNNKNHFQIHFNESDEVLEVDYLLNGTGQTADLNEKWQQQQTLIKQLLNERILMPDKHGGVQIIYPDMSAISQHFGVLSTFKIYGQLVSGVDYYNNTVDLISESAVRGVKSTVQQLDI